jgi:hypothetical protein
VTSLVHPASHHRPFLRNHPQYHNHLHATAPPASSVELGLSHPQVSSQGVTSLWGILRLFVQNTRKALRTWPPASRGFRQWLPCGQEVESAARRQGCHILLYLPSQKDLDHGAWYGSLSVLCLIRSVHNQLQQDDQGSANSVPTIPPLSRTSPQSVSSRLKPVERESRWLGLRLSAVSRSPVSRVGRTASGAYLSIGR